MHAISYQQNTGLTPVAMINRNQPGAADKHEQIRDAVRAWAASLDSRSMRMSEEAAGMAADAENFADELRKGVQS